MKVQPKSWAIKCLNLFYVRLKQISGIFVSALNRGLIQFELKADVHIIVYMTHQTLGKFISTVRHTVQ